MTIRTPLAALIEGRMRDLGLDRRDLGFRLGYRNPAKAEGCVYALCEGHLSSDKRQQAIHNLPRAIEVSSEVVEVAVNDTKKLLAEIARQVEEERCLAREEEWAQWASRFEPHAVLLGENWCPNGVIYGITGGAEKWIVIRFDLQKSPVTFVEQVQAVLPDRLHYYRGVPQVPFFGEARGYIINYSPNSAVRFDLKGEPIEQFDKAHRPGVVSVSIGNGKPVPTTALAKVFGM